MNFQIVPDRQITPDDEPELQILEVIESFNKIIQYNRLEDYEGLQVLVNYYDGDMIKGIMTDLLEEENTIFVNDYPVVLKFVSNITIYQPV